MARGVLPYGDAHGGYVVRRAFEVAGQLPPQGEELEDFTFQGETGQDATTKYSKSLSLSFGAWVASEGGWGRSHG